MNEELRRIELEYDWEIADLSEEYEWLYHHPAFGSEEAFTTVIPLINGWYDRRKKEIDAEYWEKIVKASM